MDDFAQFIKDNYNFIHIRKNTSIDWYSSDQEEVFRQNILTSPNNYNEFDFNYKFNSHGFRCDEFTEESEMPIVFLGCSMTEGVGLPLEDTWQYKLWNKIRTATGRKIPFWSLAVAGTGPMTQINLLHHFRKFIKKPVFVFAYMPPATRMEFNYGPLSEMVLSNPWSRGVIPHSQNITDDYTFQLSMLERYAPLLDAISENDCKVYFAGWSYTEDDYQVIRQCYNISLVFPLRYHELDEPGKKMLDDDKARDMWHTGPLFNARLADGFWKQSRHHFLQ